MTDILEAIVLLQSEMTDVSLAALEADMRMRWPI